MDIDAEISNLRKKIEALENHNQELDPISDKEFNNPPGRSMQATEQIARNNEIIEKLQKQIEDFELKRK